MFEAPSRLLIGTLASYYTRDEKQVKIIDNFDILATKVLDSHIRFNLHPTIQTHHDSDVSILNWTYMQYT